MKLEVLKTITFGFPRSQWDSAKAEAREELVEIAKRSGIISYGDLAAKVKAINFQANDDAFHKMLGQISLVEDEAGRGMLSVLVVHKTGDKQPGPGFFELAQQLGRDTRDRLKLWSEECTRVFDAWTKLA